MSNEAKYYEALRHIAKDYQTPEQLQKSAPKRYGLTYEEALEMAYENIQFVAEQAIKGKRRPKTKPEAS